MTGNAETVDLGFSEGHTEKPLSWDVCFSGLHHESG